MVVEVHGKSHENGWELRVPLFLGKLHMFTCWWNCKLKFFPQRLRTYSHIRQLWTHQSTSSEGICPNKSEVIGVTAIYLQSRLCRDHFPMMRGSPLESPYGTIGMNIHGIFKGRSSGSAPMEVLRTRFQARFCDVPLNIALKSKPYIW